MEQKSTATEFISTYDTNRISLKITWNLLKNVIGNSKLHKTCDYYCFFYFFVFSMKHYIKKASKIKTLLFNFK